MERRLKKTSPHRIYKHFKFVVIVDEVTINDGQPITIFVCFKYEGDIRSSLSLNLNLISSRTKMPTLKGIRLAYYKTYHLLRDIIMGTLISFA